MPQQRLEYPEHRVVGVVDETDGVDAIVDAVESAGVAPHRLEVLTAQDTDREIDPEQLSWAGRLREVLGQVHGDEIAQLQSLQDALERGAFIVQVEVPEGGDKQEAEDAKRELARTMREHGGYDVTYFGRWQTEEV